MGAQVMDVVFLAIKFHPFRFKVDTHASEDSSKVFQNGFCEYASAIFGHKDQMHMHSENAVSAVSNFIIIAHRSEGD
jgi:hypothetical protein